jgi:hypothetical protein
LEGLVINRLRAFLADPAAILDPLDDEAQSGLGQNKLIDCGRQLAEELGAQVRTEAKITLMKLLCRVESNPDLVPILLGGPRLLRESD